jgi:hypothetical protein
MPNGPRELSPQELVDVSRKLADAAAEGGVDPKAILLKLGLSLAKFNLNGKGQDIWLDIVRNIHTGIGKTAGFRSDAVAKLIEAVTEDLPANTVLSELAFRLGQGAQHIAAGNKSIFLSYSRVNRSEVDQLHDALHAADPRLVLFQDYRSVALGQDWLSVIRNNAGNAALLVCWVTSDYLKSTFCNYEVGIAESLGVRIIPLLSEPGLLGSMPAYLSKLQACQVVSPPDYPVLAAKILALLS